MAKIMRGSTPFGRKGVREPRTRITALTVSMEMSTSIDNPHPILFNGKQDGADETRTKTRTGRLTTRVRSTAESSTTTSTMGGASNG